MSAPPAQRHPCASTACGAGLELSSTFKSAAGAGYELQMGRWSRRLAALFIRFTGTTGALRVLDVGCGTGSLSWHLAQDPTIVSIRGVDVSPAYVEYAQRRESDPRVKFRAGDAYALPFADASFDHALSMLVLQFIPQAERAVREMLRVTRRGGTLAAATWDTRGGLVCMRMVYDTAAMLNENGREARAAAYTRPMSRPGDLLRLWRSAGLTDVVEDALTIRMDFTSFADFWAPNEGTEGPVAEYVATLSSDHAASLRDSVRLAYLDGESDGPRSYAATAWVVRGNVP